MTTGLSGSTIIAAKKASPAIGTGFSIATIIEFAQSGLRLTEINLDVQDWIMAGITMVLVAIAPYVTRKVRLFFGDSQERRLDKTNIFNG